MHRLLALFFVAILILTPGLPAEERPRGGGAGPPVRFQKIVLTDKYYCDGIQAADINLDGQMDIVAGPFWYKGPTFETAHEFYPAVPLAPERSPSNSMFSFVHDFTGDGWPDILVLGRVHLHPAYWYENPGPDEGGLWEKHFAFERVRGESPTMIDLDAGTRQTVTPRAPGERSGRAPGRGSGRPQVICHWDGRWGWIEPDPEDPRRPWRFQPIGENEDWPQFYHGQGVADINGDRRLDLVINDGWYEQPEDPGEDWPFHRQKFSTGRGGAQMFGDDVDGDGDTDVITALDAHGWGLAWFEQTVSAGAGGPQFVEHPIMGDRTEIKQFGAVFTQPHALDLADVDGDGLKDIVVGKRMWAHGPTGDIEPNAPPVVYWFRLTRGEGGDVRYEPHLIDDQSGVGVQVQALDVNGDGRTDVLTASKLGAFVFLQEPAREEGAGR